MVPLEMGTQVVVIEWHVDDFRIEMYDKPLLCSDQSCVAGVRSH